MKPPRPKGWGKHFLVRLWPHWDSTHVEAKTVVVLAEETQLRFNERLPSTSAQSRCLSQLHMRDAIGTSPSETVASSASNARKHVLWKTSIAITVAVVGFFCWHCSSVAGRARQLSDVEIRQFHEKLNSGNYGQIYDDADDTFRNSGREEELTKFLQAVHDRLGDAGSYTLRTGGTPSD